jgi:hypothetical protein
VPTAPPERLAADQLTMSVCPKTCRDELERLLKSVQFENAVAVTLTMKKRVGARVADSIVASENFRHFRTRLESRVLGRSARLHNRRLPLIAVLETSANHRLHYHCVIDRHLLRGSYHSKLKLSCRAESVVLKSKTVY